MSDPAYAQLLEQIAAARNAGKPMADVLGLARDFLAAQPADYADARRDELMTQIQFIMGQGPLLDTLFKAAETGDQAGGMKSLLQLYGNLQDARPQEEIDAKQAQFAKFMETAAVEHDGRQSAHRAERVKRGLSAEAGTGEPLRCVMLNKAPVDDVGFDVHKKHETHEAMWAAIHAAKAAQAELALATVPIGGSRFGGVPDLPPEFEWPMYLGKRIPFLAQFNLAEVAAATADNPLPADGWLYAFGLFDNVDEHENHVVVRIHRGPAAALTRAAQPAEEETWPDWADSRNYEAVPLAIPSNADGRTPADRGQESAGWLFGEMDEFFGTAGEMADSAFKDGGDWVNLLALESVGSMQWSDCGHLYLLIRREHLARHDFSQVLGVVCSS